MSKMYRYVFFRILKHQRSRIANRREADLAATLYIAAAPYLVLSGLVLPSLQLWDAWERLDRISQLSIAVIPLALLYIPHYRYLGTGDRVKEIAGEFETHQPYGRWGTWVVAMFYAVPITFFLFCMFT